MLAPLLIIGAAALVGPQVFGGSSLTAAAINGASQAVCSPSPCTVGTTVAYTLSNVSNDNGTSSTRAYEVYRPSHLAASQSNRVPAIIVFYGTGPCGFTPMSRAQNLANANRYIVVYMEVPCGRDNRWDKKNVNSATTATPNDEPYVAAVVHAITQCPSSGGAQNQCADPLRLYATGGSGGGNMAADVMCDQQNSPLFRGYEIDSSSIQLYNGTPDCPSTNRNYFVMLILSNDSIDAGFYYDTSVNPHLDVPHFADWAAARLGCRGTRTDGAIGSPIASTLKYTYTGGCAFALAGTPAVETLGVINGGHMWGCQDSDPTSSTNAAVNCPGLIPTPGVANGRPKTNGLYIEQEFWNMVSQGRSGPGAPPTATATPTPTPTPTATAKPTPTPTATAKPTPTSTPTVKPTPTPIGDKGGDGQTLSLTYADHGRSYVVRPGTTISVHLAPIDKVRIWTVPEVKTDTQQIRLIGSHRNSDGSVDASFAARSAGDSKIILASWANGDSKSGTVDFGVAITVRDASA
jgi:hypothetical protein